MNALFFLALSLLLAVSFATHGVDVSTLTSSSAFSCLKQNGYSFAIPRVFCSTGVVDSNGATSIKNAWAGGMNYVDGYIFPCYSCGNPEGQMQTVVDYLASHGLQFAPRNSTSEANLKGTTYGMLWLDVEGTQYWSSNQGSNIDFLQRMANKADALGVHLGVYTSKSQWTPITGGSTILAKYPLWYAHYDYNPSFSDFSAFGGWSKPAIKQYQGTTSICGASVDFSFY